VYINGTYRNWRASWHHCVLFESLSTQSLSAHLVPHECRLPALSFLRTALQQKTTKRTMVDRTIVKSDSHICFHRSLISYANLTFHVSVYFNNCLVKDDRKWLIYVALQYWSILGLFHCVCFLRLFRDGAVKVCYYFALVWHAISCLAAILAFCNSSSKFGWVDGHG